MSKPPMQAEHGARPRSYADSVAAASKLHIVASTPD